MPKRCINIDWLEVHCFEPANDPRDAQFFRSVGLLVDERPYGTRVYREMFTVCDAADNPFIEVRRNPASQGLHGIHDASECHLRLVNAACYYDNPIALLQSFIDTYGYTFNRISRIDICLDFEYFDSGDDPARFLRRYLKGVYAKINQANIHAHGSDRWDGQTWNSISWGSPTSPIGTKFYNKTLELHDPKTDTYAKPHVRYSWLLCGLVDDFHRCTRTRADGTVYKPQIWRIEFSIRSAVKRWVRIELNGKSKNFQSLPNTLERYDSKEKLLITFAALCQHYFHFKYLVKHYDFYKTGSTEGKAVRKDRCPDKILFNFDGPQIVYKVDKNISKLLGEGRSSVRPIDSLIAKIRAYRDSHHMPDIVEACQVLIRAMEGDILRSDMRNPWNYEELKALQLALSNKVAGDSRDVTVLLRELKELLKMNDQTAVFL